MLHVTIPHPSKSEFFESTSSKSCDSSLKRKTSPGSSHSNPYLKSLTSTVQFVCPILGFLMYVAAFASENWIETDTLYQWGLLTKCQPVSNLTGMTVICKFMARGENTAYFEAARGLAYVALMLYLLLQFHFKLVKVKVGRHQLPACMAAVLTVLMITVLLLVGTNYSHDPMWKDLNPSLGWAFWVALCAALFSLLATASLIYKGHMMQTHPESDSKHGGRSKVHPARHQQLPSTLHNDDNDIVVGKDQDTLSPQTEHHATPEHHKQKWTRKLSPIQERPVVVEEGQRDGSQPQPSCASHSPSPSPCPE